MPAYIYNLLDYLIPECFKYMDNKYPNYHKPNFNTYPTAKDDRRKGYRPKTARLSSDGPHF